MTDYIFTYVHLLLVPCDVEKVPLEIVQENIICICRVVCLQSNIVPHFVSCKRRLSPG